MRILLPLKGIKNTALFITEKNEVVIFNSEICRHLIILKYNYKPLNNLGECSS